MKIIDLSLPLYTGMPVFPGDPEASIEVIQTLQQHGWELRRLQINSHDGTHVNVPAHAVANGKRLQDYSLDCFCGEAVIYRPGLAMQPDKGVIFRDRNIDAAIAEAILRARPKFVALSDAFEFDLKIGSAPRYIHVLRSAAQHPVRRRQSRQSHGRHRMKRILARCSDFV